MRRRGDRELFLQMDWSTAARVTPYCALKHATEWLSLATVQATGGKVAILPMNSGPGHHHDGERVAGNGRPPGGIGKPVLRSAIVTAKTAGFGQYSEYPEYLEYFFGHSQPDADGNAMAQKEFREFKVFGLIGWPVADGTFPVRAGIGSRPIPWYIIFRSSRLPPSCV